MWVLLESYPARLLLAFILAINLEQLHSMATAAFTLRRWCLAFFILPAMFATSSFSSFPQRGAVLGAGRAADGGPKQTQ